MVIIIYVTLPAACALALFVFSFWLGRCSRKLPLIDDHLPWTMSRDLAPRCTADCRATRFPPPNPPRWPENRSLRAGSCERKRVRTSVVPKINSSAGVYLVVRYGTSADIRGRGDNGRRPVYR